MITKTLSIRQSLKKWGKLAYSHPLAPKLIARLHRIAKITPFSKRCVVSCLTLKRMPKFRYRRCHTSKRISRTICSTCKGLKGVSVIITKLLQSSRLTTKRNHHCLTSLKVLTDSQRTICLKIQQWLFNTITAQSLLQTKLWKMLLKLFHLTVSTWQKRQTSLNPTTIAKRAPVITSTQESKTLSLMKMENPKRWSRSNQSTLASRPELKTCEGLTRRGCLTSIRTKARKISLKASSKAQVCFLKARSKPITTHRTTLNKIIHK